MELTANPKYFTTFGCGEDGTSTYPVEIYEVVTYWNGEHRGFHSLARAKQEAKRASEREGKYRQVWEPATAKVRAKVPDYDAAPAYTKGWYEVATYLNGELCDAPECRDKSDSFHNVLK